MSDTTSTNDPTELQTEKLSSMARVWYTAGGVVFLVLAGLAFALPAAATFAVDIWLGVLLIIGGAVETVGAFRRHDGWGAIWEALVGIIALVAGVLAIVFPLAGILAFTVALTVFFLVSGAGRLAQALRRRPKRAWVLGAVSGVISIGLGLFLLFTLPDIAAITLGVLLAVDFAIFGVTLILMAFMGERPDVPGAFAGVPAG